ncbi:hypothetical protein [Actinomadura rupiterrae]|uniref:hypothetical protein n=1 Tax=Actinomadura rupiterrae TaxID=559627 RepID=UPI0020A4912F|nr:hypothetical protein [Actinomadura rupiterrae]MCP2335081.1 hypothetical protein [Actinomadura rupiterrae]
MASWDADALSELRAAVFRWDGAAGFDVLRNRPAAPVLQFAGDALACAVQAGCADAEPLARKCLDALDAREAPGDAVLARTLRRALENENDPGSDARPVPVDLGALAYAMEEGDAITILDLRTGDLLAEEDLHEAEDLHEPNETQEAADDLKVVYRDPAPAYDDMHDFAEARPDTPAPMQDVRAYEDALAGTELEFAWQLFHEERQRGRARQWLADNGLEPDPRAFL